MDRTVHIHLDAGKYKLEKVTCNNNSTIFSKKELQWFETPEEQVIVALKRGENQCHAITHNFGKPFHPSVVWKISYVDYVVFFIFFGLPILYFIFILFIKFLDYMRSTSGNTGQRDISRNITSQSPSKWLITIVLLGAIIRVLYFWKFGIMNFQHDWHGHIEFIHYISEHWSLPLPSKGLEYPQQPLYYFITAGIYSLLRFLGFADAEALYGLGFFSLSCSMVFLFFSYRFFRLLSSHRWVQSVGMIFISLTPSIVYMSARINNDVLVMALAPMALYYMIKSYDDNFKSYFYIALSTTSLLFMAKVSTAPFEILFFVLLITIYFRIGDKEMQNKLYIFSITGAFLLGFTLLHVYLPIEQTLHMVNSSANYPNMHINLLDINYYTSFNFTSLLHEGMSYVYGDDSIRYSFLSYQYGTMFFGEFDYSYYVTKNSILYLVMQAILSLGLIFVLGLALYIIKLPKKPLLQKLIFLVFILNIALVVSFIASYPVVCNTDFRYLVPSFVLLGYFIADGLWIAPKTRVINIIFTIILNLLLSLEVSFFILILL